MTKYTYLLVPVLFASYYPILQYRHQLNQPWLSLVAFFICFLYLNINQYYSEIGQAISDKYTLGINLMPNYWRWLLAEGVVLFSLSLPPYNTPANWYVIITWVLYSLKMVELICWTILVFGLTSGRAYEIEKQDAIH